MKIIERTNNVVRIKSSPYVGIIGLGSFLEVGGGSFTSSKSFRFTKDGINWGDWQELTTENIRNLAFSNKDTLIFELMVTGEGMDNIVGMYLSPISSHPNYIKTYFNNSIFYNFFKIEDFKVLEWYLNVLEKIWAKGLLPNYIKREKGVGENDKDFIEFWRSVAMFFAFYVALAEKFENYWQSEILLQEFLEQRGMIIGRSMSLSELQYLMKNFYREMSKRGTIQVYDRNSRIEGEFLRLIGWRQWDEFLVYQHIAGEWGWCLGRSSPLWRGVGNREGTQKIESLDLLMPISDSFTYELNFKYLGGNFTVSFKFYDINDNELLGRSSLTGNTIYHNFVQFYPFREDLSLPYKIIFYSQSKTPNLNDKLHQNQSENIILPKGIKKIKIDIVGGGVSSDIYFSPSFTRYSHGILQVKNWLSMWILKPTPRI
jgi:hypothetical protein